MDWKKFLFILGFCLIEFSPVLAWYPGSLGRVPVNISCPSTNDPPTQGYALVNVTQLYTNRTDGHLMFLNDTNLTWNAFAVFPINATHFNLTVSCYPGVNQYYWYYNVTGKLTSTENRTAAYFLYEDFENVASGSLPGEAGVILGDANVSTFNGSKQFWSGGNDATYFYLNRMVKSNISMSVTAQKVAQEQFYMGILTTVVNGYFGSSYIQNWLGAMNEGSTSDPAQRYVNWHNLTGECPPGGCGAGYTTTPKYAYWTPMNLTFKVNMTSDTANPCLTQYNSTSYVVGTCSYSYSSMGYPINSTNRVGINTISASTWLIDTLKVEQYDGLPRNWTIGAEESGATNDTMTLTAPINQTYVAQSVIVNFTAVSFQRSSFPCWYNATGGYVNAQAWTGNITNNTATIFGLSGTGPMSLVVWCELMVGSTPTNKSASIIFTMSDYGQNSTNYPAWNYETNYSALSHVFNVSGFYSGNMTSYLSWNGTIFVNSTPSSTGTFSSAPYSKTFTATWLVPTPIAQTNGSTLNIFTIDSVNSTTNITSQTSTMPVYFRQSLGSLVYSTGTVAEGNNFTVSLNETNFWEPASLDTNFTQNRTFYFNSSTFNASCVPAFSIPGYCVGSPFYGITNCTRTCSATLSTSAVSSATNFTVSYWHNESYLSFGASYRNVTGGNVSVSPINVTSCASSPFLNYSFWIETNRTTPLVSSMDSVFSVKGATGTVTKEFNFSNTGASYFGFCFSPSDTYLVNSSQSYSSTGYPSRFYYLQSATVTNSTQQINLYLDNASSFVQFQVQNPYGDPVENVTVSFSRYFPSENAYRTVAMAVSDSQGYGGAYIELGQITYSVSLYQYGELIRTFSPIYFYSNAEVVVLKTENPAFIPFFSYYGTVGYSCGSSPSGNYTSVNCSWTDTSGLMNIAYLTATYPMAFSNVSACSVSTATSSGSLLCTIPNNVSVIWDFVIGMDGVNVTLDSGTVNNPSANLGQFGPWIFMIMACLIAGLTFMRPDMMLIGEAVWTGLAFVIGLLPIGWPETIALIVILVALAIKTGEG